MNYSFQQQSIDDRTTQHTVLGSTGVMTWSNVITMWKDRSFALAMSKQLTATPCTSFRWECPALTTDDLTAGFECVTVCDPALNRMADKTPFDAYLNSSVATVTFPNISGDSLLVVPCELDDAVNYTHFGSFLQEAGEAQLVSFWNSIAKAIEQRVSDKPVWLSTAGGGVAWLHVRLDDRPKYYTYRPYGLA